MLQLNPSNAKASATIEKKVFFLSIVLMSCLFLAENICKSALLLSKVMHSIAPPPTYPGFDFTITFTSFKDCKLSFVAFSTVKFVFLDVVGTASTSVKLILE